MSRATGRKLMRLLGAVDRKTKEPVRIEAGQQRNVPMRYGGTTLLVRASEGQEINPRKEYLRQTGLSGKKLKKLRAKQKKQLSKNNA